MHTPPEFGTHPSFKKTKQKNPTQGSAKIKVLKMTAFSLFLVTADVYLSEQRRNKQTAAC